MSDNALLILGGAGLLYLATSDPAEILAGLAKDLADTGLELAEDAGSTIAKTGQDIEFGIIDLVDSEFGTGTGAIFMETFFPGSLDDATWLEFRTGVGGDMFSAGYQHHQFMINPVVGDVFSHPEDILPDGLGIDQFGLPFDRVWDVPDQLAARAPEMWYFKIQWLNKLSAAINANLATGHLSRTGNARYGIAKAVIRSVVTYYEGKANTALLDPPEVKTYDRSTWHVGTVIKQADPTTYPQQPGEPIYTRTGLKIFDGVSLWDIYTLEYDDGTVIKYVTDTDADPPLTIFTDPRFSGISKADIDYDAGSTSILGQFVSDQATS